MKNLLHILGCLIPLLLIFILPALGVSQGVTFTVFIVLMLGCHLLMMGTHSSSRKPPPSKSNNPENP